MKISEIAQNTNQISNPDISGNSKVQEENRGTAEQGGTSRPVATVELSDTSMEFSKAAEAMEITSEERIQKVQSLKSMIKNGTYQIDAKDIAEGILKDSMATKVGS